MTVEYWTVLYLLTGGLIERKERIVQYINNRNKISMIVMTLVVRSDELEWYKG